MKKTSETIVFFGSGPVAADSLQRLHHSFNIETVVTKPIPPHHRGGAPVVKYCVEHGIPMLQVNTKSELSDAFHDVEFTSKIGLVIDFGIIIAKDVIDSFPKGIMNSHFSLLPEWRGADPISFAILSGQEITGVSLMLIVERMDEGPLLAQSFYKLTSDITTPELTEALIDISDTMLKEIIPLYLAGEIGAIPQDTVAVMPTYSRKITKEDGTIDWQKPAEQIEREIRAFIEWPKSHTQLAGKDVIIKSAEVVKAPGAAGKVVVKSKDIIVYCGKDALKIISLQPTGKKEMATQAFLAGHGSKL